MPAKKSAAAQALGETIRNARKERGVAQATFARHVGLDRSYYGAIERGEFNITLDTLVKIAVGLRVRPSKLLRQAQL
jgi:transcriptional regulator with XRE-family HTH domain